MTSNLIQDLIPLVADLQNIAVEMGVQQYRQLAIRKRIQNPDKTITLTDRLLYPRPQIETVSTQYVGLPVGNIEVIQTDLQANKVSRAYPKEYLEKQVEFYILDPVFSTNPITGDRYISNGTRCRLIFIEDKATLYWRLLLREYPDQSNFPTTRVSLDESVPT